MVVVGDGGGGGLFQSDMVAIPGENARGLECSRAKLPRIMLIHGPRVLGTRQSAKQGKHEAGKESGPAHLWISQAPECVHDTCLYCFCRCW